MLQLCVTEFGLKYLHATMFYFHQHLLKKYNTPRYALPDPVYHFKNYSSNRQTRGTAEPITSNNTYLYNRRDKSEIGMLSQFIVIICTIFWFLPRSEKGMCLTFFVICDRFSNIAGRVSSKISCIKH